MSSVLSFKKPTKVFDLKQFLDLKIFEYSAYENKINPSLYFEFRNVKILKNFQDVNENEFYRICRIYFLGENNFIFEFRNSEKIVRFRMSLCFVHSFLTDDDKLLLAKLNEEEI